MAMTKILLELKPCNLSMYLTKLQITCIYSFISISLALDYNKRGQLFFHFEFITTDYHRLVDAFFHLNLIVPKETLPQSLTFPYTIYCLHTLLRQTYTRNNPRFFFSFCLPYALLCLAKTEYLHFITQHKQQGSVGIGIYIYRSYRFGENLEMMKTIVGSRLPAFIEDELILNK
ncbi:hypothetical protein YC2023_107172 [Brassica napus]